MDVDFEGDGAGIGDGKRFKGRRTVTAKYVRNACGQCRKAYVQVYTSQADFPFIYLYRKAKCDGTKPVCERCLKTGHEVSSHQPLRCGR
jgi:hypothetical protein